MRSFIAILFTIVLVIQVTVMAQDKEPQQDKSSDKQNVEKCNADIFSIIDKSSVLEEELSKFNVTDGSGAASGLNTTVVEEAKELIYKTTYDCCAIPREVTENITNKIFDEIPSDSSPETILELIQPLTNCSADKIGVSLDATIVPFIQSILHLSGLISEILDPLLPNVSQNLPKN